MAATDSNPISQNLQSPVNFAFRLKRAPSLSYRTQSFKVPNVSLRAAKAPSPSLSVNYVGDHVEFQPLALTFLVDEQLQNWLEIFNWMTGSGNVENTGTEYATMANRKDYSGYGIYSELQMFQMNSQKIPILVYTFERCQPISLGGPQFDTKDTSINYLTSEVVFSYTKFSISTP